MEAEFWQEAWKIGKTHFHMSSYNLTLLKFFPKFEISKEAIVLVPLCGKTLDLIWLRDQGHRVIGVELSELAVLDFFKENNIDFKIEKIEHFKVFTSKNITIYCGDFFNLSKSLIKTISAVYDRAALIALPERMRSKYLKHMSSLIDTNTNVLLLSFERSPQTNHGPPHSIPREEMLTNTKSYFTLSILEETKEKIKSKLLKKEGINHMQRIVYHLVKK